MENSPPSNLAFATVVNWTSFFIGLTCIGFLGWYIPADRRGYVAIFESLDLQLPHSTRFMLAIPDLAFPAIAIAYAIGMVAVQCLVRAKNAATVFHILAIALSCVVLVIYRDLVFQPLSKLIRDLSSG
jgi:hypothetical protein